MIKLINVNKYYSSSSGKFHALKNINLTLPNNGMVYIVGKSGSGKSTLLNVIGGIDKYDSGEIILETKLKNNKIQTLNTKSFTRANFNAYRNSYIGFIFQEFNVIKGLTVYENIALSLDLKRESVKDNKINILNTIEKVGLIGKENRRINELSGGERQRVAIARALIKNPEIIIADEPTGNLDAKNRDIVMNILKELSKEKLILIVTHDKSLASIYGDRLIKIKDGEITSDEVINNDYIEKDIITNNPIKEITPKSIVSLKLAWKGFCLNKLRFILIILLFSISLVFAGSVVNLYLANTTKEYATFQKDYGNFVVTMNDKHRYFDSEHDSAFYEYSLANAKKLFQTSNDTSSITTLKSMKTNINIDISSTESGLDNIDNFYRSSINTINVYDEKQTLYDNFTVKQPDIPTTHNYKCYITDYLLFGLCVFNTYNKFVTEKTVIDKELYIDGCTEPFYIEGVIKTNYTLFENLVNNNFEGLSEEEINKYKATFEDNLSIYNSIFVSNETYKSFFSTSNIEYFNDNILCLNDDDTTTLYNNITFKPFTDDTLLIGEQPKKPIPGNITEVCVSKGFLEDIIGIPFEHINMNKYLCLTDDIVHSFYVCGIERIPSSLEFIVSGIIDSNEHIIVTPTLEESSLFSNLLSNSFVNGGFLTALIKDDIQTNAKVYRNILNNDITINNPSFKKLQIVDDFINDNIFMFAALFFTFCMFSILMIFNFIIITIKNSTRDIGIYMSLGMNGFKISLIYIFQVLIMSSIALVIGLIGSTIFINQIDSSFKDLVLVNFKILENTPISILIIFALAYVTPILAIISPIISLANKKPIDVIKVS